MNAIPYKNKAMRRLESLQDALLDGRIRMRVSLGKDIYLHYSRDGARFRYASIKKGIVQSLVEFEKIDALDEKPCFSIICAVPEVFRCERRATRLMQASIADFQKMLSYVKKDVFYFMAVIEKNEVVANKLALKTLLTSPVENVDPLTGERLLTYKIEFNNSSTLTLDTTY